MKKIITAFIFCFLFGECFSQAGEWVWIKGDSVPNQAGSYGVQGVPSPTNNPPSLYEPCEWTDLNGNFWLFGGLSGTGYCGDLWKYDITNNEWTWMKGSGNSNDPGDYGAFGIPSPTNNPPARGFGVTSWVDKSGNLWLFGGKDPAVNSYSDLWKYNIATNMWSWEKGPNVTNQLGVYGTMGVPSPLNVPKGRWECAAGWTDNSGDLWLFGGFIGQFTKTLNDLCRYNIASHTWTWMKGAQYANQLGIYGTIGVEDSLNKPGARQVYSHWKDSNGRLWLFGGMDSHNGIQFNDLWRFNISTNNWAWMGGGYFGYHTPGIYGTKCASSSINIPGTRYESRASWADLEGNFWFFGGIDSAGSRNDLWKYCIATGQWIWESGDSIYDPIGNWGTIGVSSLANKPSGRLGSVGWTDYNRHLFLFGGWNSNLHGHNDLWKYTIDTTCGVCPTNTGIVENNFTNELLVFPNPTNSSLTISFSSSEKQSVELRIYNTLANQIYFSKQEITKGKFEKEINVEKLSDGIYFLQLKTKDGVVNRKLVIQR